MTKDKTDLRIVYNESRLTFAVPIEPVYKSLPEDPMTDEQNLNQPETEESGGTSTALLVIGGIAIGAILILIVLALAGVFSGDGQGEVPESAGASIIITQPINGAVLDIANPILVTGTGAGLPEGNVVVRALDAGGKVLAELPTTVQATDAGTGGAGFWSVQLTVQTTPGTTGQISALSSSPADGSVLAEDSVTVIYGQAEVAQPFIEIDQPADGATIDVPNPVTVSGLGGALPEGNVVVQALDASGNVLAEQATIIQAEDAGTGGAGPWSLEMVIPVQPGTTGTITAFSTSPADGSNVAEDSVGVMYGEAVSLNTFIEINQPQNGATLPLDNSIIVSGRGGGLYEGNVFVQAVNAIGDVLAEQATVIQSEDAGSGGAGPWSVELAVQAAPGTIGQLRAFSPSPDDGSILVSDEIDVTYGEQVASAIAITDPVEGAVLLTIEPILVVGTGVGLPEGNVVVQAKDGSGKVLAQEVTTMESQEVGGAGVWAVQLNVQVIEETQGQIVAFSPSPAGDGFLAEAEVPVTYAAGAKEVNLEDHLWLLTSLAGRDVLEGTQIMTQFQDGQVSGSAGCNNYFAGYVVDGNQLTIEQPGTSQVDCQEPEGIMDQENQYLSLLQTSATFRFQDGQLEILDSNDQLILLYNAAVIGTISPAEAAELPEDALATIQLNDVSLLDAPAVTIGEQVIDDLGQFPISFAVTYNPEDIVDNHTYAIQVRITNAEGNLLFITTSAYDVITQENPSVVDVIVEAV